LMMPIIRASTIRKPILTACSAAPKCSGAN
jgi:hypothetical protein